LASIVQTHDTMIWRLYRKKNWVSTKKTEKRPLSDREGKKRGGKLLGPNRQGFGEGNIK